MPNRIKKNKEYHELLVENVEILLEHLNEDISSEYMSRHLYAAIAVVRENIKLNR